MKEIDDDTKQEVEAIQTLLSALRPLQAHTRKAVLSYVFQSLKIDAQLFNPESSHQSDIIPVKQEKVESRSLSATKAVHIKEFMEEKKPKSANEMAVIVAYYLENLASADIRKETVNTADLRTYFKIAGFKLPTRIDLTLANAKNAGYLKSAGNGEYKLSAIGENLVTHSMPR